MSPSFLSNRPPQSSSLRVFERQPPAAVVDALVGVKGFLLPLTGFPVSYVDNPNPSLPLLDAQNKLLLLL